MCFVPGLVACFGLELPVTKCDATTPGNTFPALSLYLNVSSNAQHFRIATVIAEGKGFSRVTVALADRSRVSKHQLRSSSILTFPGFLYQTADIKTHYVASRMLSILTV